MKIKINKALFECLRVGADGAVLERSNTSNLSNKVYRNRSRTWFFTWNNYKDSDIGALSHTFREWKIKKYIFQEEIGDENGVPHLQGVVMFHNDIEFVTMCSINKCIHWEKPKKKWKYNVWYCSKFETRKEGTIPYRFNIKDSELAQQPSKILQLTYQEQLDYMRKQSMLDDLPTEEEKEIAHQKKMKWIHKSWDDYYEDKLFEDAGHFKDTTSNGMEASVWGKKDL